MDLTQAILLGIIQGLTEFLPVSSSGHLVLLQNLFGIHEPALLFDICLHGGTLVAVFIVFSKDIIRIGLTLLKLPFLIKSGHGFKNLFQNNKEIRMALLIIIGSIPTAILGLLFKEITEHIFSSVWLVGLMLLITGSFLWLSKTATAKGRLINQMTIKDALVIGFVQGLAIIPGISRSGATICAALFLGIDRGLAGQFSFLLSIPAILGALLLSFDLSASSIGIDATIILIGTIAAALTGFMALKILLRVVQKGHLYYFAPYCWLVAIVTFICVFK